MSASGGEASEFERLKTLLLRPEVDRLSAAEVQLHDLQAWVGDAPRLETATAQILVEAFRRAEVARHRELAAAIAPVVVAAIRSEIHNSRDMMVEALYPITGRLVSAAVANAFRELLDAINQRLDALVSTNQWRLRARALMTGRSVAEIALAEAREATYARILLLERGSGKLLAHWEPGPSGQDNSDLVSGMIAAITEFASTVLSEQHGELRTLDLGASQVFLRASSRIILAAEMVGEVGARRRKSLDAGFLDLVDRHDRGETLSESDLAALAESAKKPTPRRGGWARWATIGLIAAVALGFASRGPVYRWIKSRDIAAAHARALADDPALADYPLTVGEDWSARMVIVRGLAGSAAQVDRLVATLVPAAAPLAVKPEVEIIATTSELAAAREAQAREAASLAEARAALAAQADALAALNRRDDADRAVSETQTRAIRADIEQLQAALADPRRVIAEAAARAIVNFSERDSLADPAAAGKNLDALADAIKRTGMGVRVIGYSDESGLPSGNVEFSRARAAKVARMLVERGVAPDRLVQVGRGAQIPIADVADPRLRNRRVVFEPLFPGEPAP